MYICNVIKNKTTMKLLKKLYRKLQDLAKACPKETKWNA